MVTCIAIADELRQFLRLHYGLDAAGPLLSLPTKGNRLAFMLRAEQGSYIVKVTSPERTTAQVERDLAALLFLERHAFPAPRVVRTITGRTHLQFQARHAYLYRYIDGAMPQPDEQVLHRLGLLLGRLHCLPTVGYSHTSGFTPPTEFPLVADLLRRHLSGPFAAQASELLRDIAAFPTFDGLPEAIIHSDPYFPNLVQTPGGELHLIDLDDAGLAPALIDVGYVLSTCCTLTRQDRRRFSMADGSDRPLLWRGDWARAFLTSYQRLRPLTTREKALLPAAASFAMLAYMIDWDTGAFLAPNYERYHLLKREVPRIIL